MTIIRDFILKQWFKFLAASIIALYLLLTVANLISGFLRDNVQPFEVILNHFVQTPGHLKLIIPISCLIASLFSINQLKNRNELTAIFSTGYSRQKVLLDIFYASLIVGAFQFFISAYLEPLAKSKRHLLIENSESKFRNLKSKGLMSSTIGSGKIWFKSDQYFFSFDAFNKRENTIQGITAYYFTKKNNGHKNKKTIIAPKAVFKNKNWFMEEAFIYTNLDNEQFPEGHKHKSVILDIKEEPNDFLQIESDITTLSFLGLLRYIQKLSLNGINVDEYLVTFLEKISTPLICIIFALISSITIFNPNRRNSSLGKSLIIIFIFTILYWLINSYFIQLGISSRINPYVATFGVPSFFFLFLLFSFYRNRNLR